MTNAESAANEQPEGRYRLSIAAPEFLQPFIRDVAEYQAAFHFAFDLPPVGVSVRVVDDFAAQVNAVAARSVNPPLVPFDVDRGGDSVVVAKSLQMNLDATEFEIFINAESRLVQPPVTVGDYADLVWLVGHEMTHPLWWQLRAATSDLAAVYPAMSGRRSLRRSLLDGLDEFRCERVAEVIVEQLVFVEDPQGSDRRGVTADDLGDRYGETWAGRVRDTAQTLVNLGAQAVPDADLTWLVNQVLAANNNLVQISGRAAAYADLTAERAAAPDDAAYVVKAMRDMWAVVADNPPLEESTTAFALVERSFLASAEGHTASMWTSASIDIGLDDPWFTGQI